MDLGGIMHGPEERNPRRDEAGWFVVSRGWRKLGMAEAASGDGVSFWGMRMASE